MGSPVLYVGKCSILWEEGVLDQWTLAEVENCVLAVDRESLDVIFPS